MEPSLTPAQLRQALGAMQNRWQQEKAELLNTLYGLRTDLDRITKEKVEKVPRFVDDIPGPRVPYEYIVKVPFTAGATTAMSSSVTIATDGPFICTQMEAYWKITSGGSYIGYWFPITRLPFMMQAAGNSGGVPAWIASEVGEFSFKVTTGGSGRQWQSDWMAGPHLKGWGVNPHYVGIQGWVDRSNVLSVEVQPEVAVPSSCNGDVWFYFSGYQILVPIEFKSTFGWQS